MVERVAIELFCVLMTLAPSFSGPERVCHQEGRVA